MELVIDTSAIMAILQSEEEARLLLGVVVAADRRRMSAASYVELGVVTDRSGEPRLVELMDRFLHTAEIEIEPVTVRQAQLAREAHSKSRIRFFVSRSSLRSASVKPGRVPSSISAFFNQL